MTKVILKSNNPQYLQKDQLKSNRANKFIGRGSPNSSTESYRLCWGALANCGYYEFSDIVFVSVEGNRSNRVEPDYEEILKAIQAGVTFIIDIEVHRNRPYNIGEREVYDFLKRNSYYEKSPGVMKPLIKL